MEHINELRINKFRGLRDLKIEGLGQVNLFVGNNNSGKTSVLEALSLFCDPLNWRSWYDVGSQRDSLVGPSSGIDRITWLFAQGANLKEEHHLSISAVGNTPLKEVSAVYEKFSEILTMSQLSRPSISISIEKVKEMEKRLDYVKEAIDDKYLVDVEGGEKEIEGVRLSITASGEYIQPTSLENKFVVNDTITFDGRFSSKILKNKVIPNIPVMMISPFSHRISTLTSSLWSDVVQADLKTEIIQLVQHFDPAILDVDFIAPTESRQLISVKHAKLGRAPLYTFGDGLRSVFTLAAAIARVRNGFLLIDELESSIHIEALEKAFEWLVMACVDNNVQLLATTHSLEALDSMSVVSLDIEDFIVYRLQQEKERTIAKRFDKAKVLRLREDLGMDLR